MPSPEGLPGRVVDVVPLGAARQLTIGLAGGERLLATLPNRPDRAHEPGQSVIVAFPREGCVPFPASA